MIDVHTIGAGGGSIAFVDQAGAFKVGPRSAGAVPGPAAYGRGGNRATVTDANVVLGRLDRGNFLGGGMSLDEVAARRVIGELARELGLTDREAAEGVITVINANMANAIRSRTVQKGIDPRDYALVAFGGAGPLHGAEVADMLGIPEVIVPPHPGITSAVGLLTSDLRYDAIRTSFQVSGAADLARINADFAAMAKELAERFTADGIDLANVTFERRGDLRYVGQGYELRVPFPDGTIDDGGAGQGVRGLPRDPSPRIRPSLRRVRHRDREPAPGRRRAAPPRSPSRPSARPSRSTRRGCARAPARSASTASSPTIHTDFYRRDLLPVGERIAGPAIILQMDSHHRRAAAAQSFETDAAGNLIITAERLRHEHAPRIAASRPRQARPHRPDHRRGDPGRAGEHRHRDGLQAHAHELLLDHPRVGGFRRGAGRCRGPRPCRIGADRRRCSPARSPATSAAS